VDTLQIIVSGLTLGAIYGLIALGVVIIVKASDLVNFAHGEMVMIGAITAHIIRISLGIHWTLAFVGAVVVTLGVGMLLERVAYRPLRNSPTINVVLASVALSLLLQNLALVFWSEDTRAYPAMFSEAPILLGRFRLVPQDWATIAAALGCMLAFQVFFTRTRTGLAMRAVMLDRSTASLMGINVYRTIGNTFGASAALGAAAGVLVAPLIQIHFSMGFILVKAFAAACLGGIFSIPGAIVGGLLIGVIEGLVAAYVSTAYRDAIVYAILVAALLFRPEGLLGRR
jgi:branched-subunit amino acid ABC-type transport system permease component